jgi:restriction system protein
MYSLDDYQQLMKPQQDGQAVRPEHRGAAPGGLTAEGIAALTNLALAAQRVLQRELIARIHAQPPAFFERLVIDLLLSMGYGADRAEMARCLGRSGDGGIDGVITLDELSLEQICIQAKRLKPGVAVPISDVRDFAGSLEARRASKGVFVATTHFSAGAEAFCAKLSRRVVLIDGDRLAELMIRFNIGVKVQHSFELKALDRAYFAIPAVGPQS